MNDRKELWFSRKFLIEDIIFAIIPWSGIAFILVWSVYFGPNGNPPWRIGDGRIYDWFIGAAFPWFCITFGIFMIAKTIIYRSNLAIKTIAILSYAACAFIGPVFAFA